MNFCPNCGAKIARPGEDVFCTSCGTRLIPAPGQPDAPHAAAPPAAGAPAQFSGRDITAAPAPAPAMPQQKDLLDLIDHTHQSDLLNLIDEKQGHPKTDIFAGAGAPPKQDIGIAVAPLPSAAAHPAPQPTHLGTTTVADNAPQQDDLFAGTEAPPEQDGLFTGAEAPPEQDGLFAGAEAPPESNELFGEAETSYSSHGPAHTAAPPVPKHAHERVAHQHAPHAEKPVQPVPPPAKQSYAPPAKPSYYPDEPYTEQPYGTQQRSGNAASVFDEQDETGSYPAAGRVPAYMQQNQPGRVAVPKRPLPPPIDLPEAEPIKKRSVGRTILMFFVIVVVFAIVFSGTILTMLYFQNRPAKAVDEFAQAVVDVDVDTLQKLVTVEGTTPTTEQWQAFCAAFKQRASLNTLKSQLLMLAEDPNAATLDYPAVTIDSQPFILFINRYKVKINAVSVMAPGAAPGSTLRLDNTDITGTPGEGGELFSGIMPGQYQCRLVPPGVDPNTVEPFQAAFFGVDGPNILEGAHPTATVTIENCISDDASLYINDAPVTERPVGGIVVLSNVPLGATIRINAVVDGVLKESSVVFSDLGNANLRFENYADVQQNEGEVAPQSAVSS